MGASPGWVEEKVWRLGEEQSAMSARFDSMDERLSSIDRKLDKVLAGVESHGNRLTVLEVNDKNRRQKYRWIAGVAAAIVTTLALSILGLS